MDDKTNRCHPAILLIGAPGAGKGTQGKVLGTVPRFFHCACGDVFRSLDTRTELGQRFVHYSSRGELVPDELTIDLWKVQLDNWIDTYLYKQDIDILVIGSGAAGLTLALRAAEFGHVTVLSKGDLNQGATFYAQGGIAAVLDAEDSIESHVQDTLSAGVGLCHPDIVEYIVANSAEAVSWLVAQGVPFTTKPTANQPGGTAPGNADLTSLHLTQEGGHSHRRIIHATDATGKAVFETLQERAQAHPRITLLRHKTLTVSKHFGSPGWLETPKAAVQVRDSWRKMTPLVEWAEQILR